MVISSFPCFSRTIVLATSLLIFVNLTGLVLSNPTSTLQEDQPVKSNSVLHELSTQSKQDADDARCITVQEGDICDNIIQKPPCLMTIDEFYQSTGLNKTQCQDLKVGQKICCPDLLDGPNCLRVKEGDICYDIANKEPCKMPLEDFYKKTGLDEDKCMKLEHGQKICCNDPSVPLPPDSVA